jgi:hypothetical protein
MRIKFYLKRPEAIESTVLYALINYNGETLKIYTNESIKPKFWNHATQSARVTPKFPEAPEFNERINHIRSSINRLFLTHKFENDHKAPSPQLFKGMIATMLRRGEQKNDFISYFEDFVRRSMNGERIDPRSRLPIRYGVAKVYQSTLNSIKDYLKASRKKRLDFKDIDLEFHKDFTSYLSKPPRNLSINTIGSNFQRIKAVMAEATEMGVNTNMKFKSKHFVKQSEDAETIYLDSRELKEMEALDLQSDSKLDNVRDLFLIGAYTGLRYSDFSILKPESINEGYIRITQTKTLIPVTIPVHSVVKKIIRKHEGKIPRSISNQKMNSYLKDIGKLMPSLKKTESKTITKGGKGVTTNYEKWELLTTHTARRSFATNEYLAGTPSLTIMAITGHRTEKAFLKYIRVTSEEHAKKIKELWTKREGKLKAV